MKRTVILYVLFLLFIPVQLSAEDDRYAALRKQMIKEIEADAKYTSRELGRSYLDERVLKIMGEVPRHEFVSTASADLAYRNFPLPIGHGQTISQPYIVALMSDLMELKGEDTVLEIGTGSGYQAAVLAGLAKEVYTIEIIKELGESARQRLKRLGYDNVAVKVGDGYYGWKEHAPFDAIIVTCAAGHVPLPLLEQLKPGGRIVIPIGSVYTVQTLMVVTKEASGEIMTRRVLPVRFVPMTGRTQRSR
jgi:protein-L-isoaspartate(D-aspartate) O-methyltransferase